MHSVRKSNYYLTRLNYSLECISMIAYIFMMVLTTADIIGAKLFLAPIPGALDMMMLAQLIMLSFALGGSYIAGKHVEVTFFVDLLPELIKRLIAVAIKFLMLLLFVLITWRMLLYGLDLKNYNEVSPTVRLALYPYAFAAVIAFIPATLAALIELIQAIIAVVQWKPKPRPLVPSPEKAN